MGFRYLYTVSATNLRARDVGMDAVRLIQPLDTGDAFKEERYQRYIFFARQVGKHISNLLLIFPPGVGRRQHAGKQDLRIFRLSAVDNLGEVLLRFGYRLSAQKVIRTQLKNQKRTSSHRQAPSRFCGHRRHSCHLKLRS